MRDKLTIILQERGRIKQFSFSKEFKKRFKFVTLALLILFMATIAFMRYQLIRIDNLEVSLKKSMQSNHKLSERNLILLAELEASKLEIQDKADQLASLDTQLNDIESMMGISPDEGLDITKRVEKLSLTSEQMELVFKNIPNGSPIEYNGITSSFGYRIHPISKKRAFHKGIDLRAAMRTPVYATANAIVEYARWHKKSGYGRLVILSHNYGFRTFYGHLKSIEVKAGDFVQKGDLIGYSGSSGTSNGPHLHYAIHFIERALNPYHFIKWDRPNYNDIFIKEARVPWNELISVVSAQGLKSDSYILSKTGGR